MPSVNPARIVLMLVPMILSLTFHEFAHARVARWLGDDTAERQGRLTLNPLAHVDLFGTLLIPIVGAMTGVPLIGWAKPVPVNPARFKRGVNPWRGYGLVAAAGPFSNLLLALISAAIIAFGGVAIWTNRGVMELLGAMLFMNVGLFVFNLLPLPPLDGSRLLPRSTEALQAKIQPYSMFILMGILWFGPLKEVLIVTPVRFVLGAIGAIFRLPIGL